MFVNRGSIALIISIALALTACANYTPRIRQSEKPTGNEAYLYGRFAIDAPKVWGGLDGHQTMGFAFKCDNDETYTIRFSKDTPIQIIKIVPSTCSFVELIFSNADGQIQSRKPAPASAIKNVRFEAAKAYYLGDFAAKTTKTVTYPTVHTTWSVTSIKDDYQKTTSEMKAAFPNLSAIATENKMIIVASPSR